MTISELVFGDVITMPAYSGYWMATGRHPYGGIESRYLMVRVDAWPFDVQSVDEDTTVSSLFVVKPGPGFMWNKCIGTQFVPVPMGADMAVQNVTEASKTVPSKIEAICEYLREQLYEVHPEDGRPGLMKLDFESGTNADACELCGEDFNDGEQIIWVDYDTDKESDLGAAVCRNLKVCQQRRDDVEAAVMLKQQQIAETVILP